MASEGTLRDLHLHLSGGTPPVLLWELVQEAGLKTDARTFPEFERNLLADPSQVDSLESYLKLIHLIDDAQSYPRAVELCAYQCFKDSYLAGVGHLELRFNCVKRSQGGRIDLDKIIVAARAGMERAKTNFGMGGGLVLCLGRDCSEAENAAVFEMAVRYNGKGVIGLDVAGPEAGNPLHRRLPYLEYFYRAARAAKLITTVHCGETQQPWSGEELEWVLTKLRPRRLGHGLRLSDHPALLRRAASDGVELEICPSSNLVTRAVASPAELGRRLEAFAAAGVVTHICTDATHLLRTDLRRERAIAEAARRTARSAGPGRGRPRRR